LKHLAYILAITVLFFSVKPAIDATPFSVAQQKTCCSSKCSPLTANQNSENHNEPEENEMCNPFQACGSCLLLCGSSGFLPALQTDIPTDKFFGYQSHIASQFISDFWQPPKIV
jgi:hypothetical protein